MKRVRSINPYATDLASLVLNACEYKNDIEMPLTQLLTEDSDDHGKVQALDERESVLRRAITAQVEVLADNGPPKSKNLIKRIGRIRVMGKKKRGLQS